MVNIKNESKLLLNKIIQATSKNIFFMAYIQKGKISARSVKAIVFYSKDGSLNILGRDKSTISRGLKIKSQR